MLPKQYYPNNYTVGVDRSKLSNFLEPKHNLFDMKGQALFLCSPYRSYKITGVQRSLTSQTANVQNAKQMFLELSAMSNLVLAPHLHIAESKIFNEEIPDEREKGISIGHEWLEFCTCFLVFPGYNNYISSGMKAEISKWFSKDKDFYVYSFEEKRFINCHAELNKNLNLVLFNDNCNFKLEIK